MTRVGRRGFYGEIDILVLKTLGHGEPMHGLAIIDAVRESSGEYLQIEDAALYPSLHRLHRKGLLKGEWKISEKRRRAKFYELTLAGRKELARALKEWTAHTRALGRVLEVKPEDLL
jgi:PadR family transcriptional regulator PadR